MKKLFVFALCVTTGVLLISIAPKALTWWIVGMNTLGFIEGAVIASK